MKKITLIFCAMLMVLGVNANVRQIRRAAEANPQKITLKANMGYLYNWEGTTDDKYQAGVAPKGVMRLELGVTSGEGDNFQFKKNLIVYFYDKNSQTGLNGIHELGIYYGDDGQGNELYLYDNIIDINGNGNQNDIKAMTGAYLQASVIGVENNTKKYDLYFISNEYEFAVQVPVIGINNVIANEDPTSAAAFFVPSDETFFMNESATDFEDSYPEVEVNYDPTYNPNLVRIHGYKQNQSWICLDFIVSEVDPQSYIPVGTYTVSGTGEANTVVKSTGYLAADVQPSFASVYDSDGYMGKVWFLSKGEAVVEFNGTELRVTVEAENAYGKKVKAVIGTLNTAIGETTVDAQATKAMVNGQLVIIRNGVRYNAQGAVVE